MVKLYRSRPIAAFALLIGLSAYPLRATPVQADFAFLIDATTSMAGEIDAVAAGLSSFVEGLNAAEIDARFAIVLFGGAPELVQDFTSDASAVAASFGQINTSGAVAGFQENHNLNPEAGLEAIRIALGTAADSTLLRTNVGGSSGLLFRSDAVKNLILVTDEDSDRPFYADNRVAGQGTVAPPTNIASTAWQDEVDATAAGIIAAGAYINLLINPTDAPTRSQYGDPNSDVSDADFLNYDHTATLAQLINNGYGNSLQAQVLSAGLVGRAFNIVDVDSPDFIDNFFAAKIREIPPTVIPEPSSWLITGAGAVLLALLRFRRRQS